MLFRRRGPQTPRLAQTELLPEQSPAPWWAGWWVAWPESYRSWPELAQLSPYLPRNTYFFDRILSEESRVSAGLHPTGPSWCFHSGQGRPAFSGGRGHGALLLLSVPGTPSHQEGLCLSETLAPVPLWAKAQSRCQGKRGQSPCRERPSPAGVLAAAWLHPAPSNRRTEGCPLGPPWYFNHPQADGAAQTPPHSPDSQMSSSTAPLCSLRRYHLSLSGRGRVLTLASTGHG